MSIKHIRVRTDNNPSSDDSHALGASGTAWSDLFLADGGVVNFNEGDVTLTHASNKITLAGGVLSGMTHSIWVQPHAVEDTSTHHQAWQNYGRSSVGDASNPGGVFFSAAIPSDFSTMTKALVVFIAGDDGNVLWECDAQFASTGQIYSTHSGSTASGAATTTAVLDNLVYEVSVIAALSGIAAGDYLGVEWVYTAASTNTNAAVLGLLLEYTT
jgi:hypothetical protein